MSCLVAQPCHLPSERTIGIFKTGSGIGLQGYEGTGYAHQCRSDRRREDRDSQKYRFGVNSTQIYNTMKNPLKAVQGYGLTQLLESLIVNVIAL